MLKRILFTLLITAFFTPAFSQYRIPPEWHTHSATWLQWPHDSTYYIGYRDFFEPAWIDMTLALDGSEQVFIIAYDSLELEHITSILADAGADMDSLQFFVFPNNDYWVRDNGPIFVLDSLGQTAITDWNFDGWGDDAPYTLCDVIPASIGGAIGIPVIDLSAYTLEGGAVEHDGNGTFIGTISSILGDGRNPGLTTDDMEEVMQEYLGFEQFIWLEGAYGGGFDITDSHIDGFLRFRDEHTIVTMNTADLNYWFVNAADRDLIFNALNTDGEAYDYVYLPLTDKNVKTTEGMNTGSKGSYVNYYEGNQVVLVPVYADDNDSLALSIMQDLYPDKEVIGIDCRNMFYWGGMVHCVTQQQPASEVITTSVSAIHKDLQLLVYPNPASEWLFVQTPFQSGQLSIQDMQGRILWRETLSQGQYELPVSHLAEGRYLLTVSYGERMIRSSFVVQH